MDPYFSYAAKKMSRNFEAHAHKHGIPEIRVLVGITDPLVKGVDGWTIEGIFEDGWKAQIYTEIEISKSDCDHICSILSNAHHRHISKSRINFDQGDCISQNHSRL